MVFLGRRAQDDVLRNPVQDRLRHRPSSPAGGLKLPRPTTGAIVPHCANLCRRKCDIPDPATILGGEAVSGPVRPPQAAQKGHMRGGAPEAIRTRGPIPLSPRLVAPLLFAQALIGADGRFSAA